MPAMGGGSWRRAATLLLAAMALLTSPQRCAAQTPLSRLDTAELLALWNLLGGAPDYLRAGSPPAAQPTPSPALPVLAAPPISSLRIKDIISGLRNTTGPIPGWLATLGYNLTCVHLPRLECCLET